MNFQLPEVDFRNRSDKRTFDIHCTEAASGNFPYTFVAHEDDVKADWLREIQEHSEEDRELTKFFHSVNPKLLACLRKPL